VNALPLLRAADRRAPLTEAPQGRLGEALRDAANGRSGVVLLGLEALDDESWVVLAAAGIRLEWAAETEDAVRALTHRSAQLVIADADKGSALAAAVRAA
jgi:hypothetical protein